MSKEELKESLDIINKCDFIISINIYISIYHNIII